MPACLLLPALLTFQPLPHTRVDLRAIHYLSHTCVDAPATRLHPHLQVDSTLCPNACSGRGQCMRGFCHCKRGWFGLDCSRSHAATPRPENVPSRKRPVVYVYELPHSLSSPAISLDDDVSNP